MRCVRESWRIVLVRPRNPLNIGAAARAMANFGFRDLVVVEPYGPVWRETRSAVGAQEIVRGARAVESLAEALHDVSLVVGTTCGQRRRLDQPLISLDDFSEGLQRRAGRRALVFGSEKTGLSNESMSYCHALVRIPTTPRCPSMNLGQAVAVCCFELARWSRTTQPAGQVDEADQRRGKAVLSSALPSYAPVSAPASIQSLEHVLERATRVLDQSGYLKPKSRQVTLIKLRRMLIERRLSNHDAKILGGILAQIEWKLQNLQAGDTK